MNGKQQVINSVEQLLDEAQKDQEKINTFKEQIDDMIVELPEYAAVQALKNDLAMAEASLKAAIMGVAEINNAKEALADLKDTKKMRDEIISGNLLSYIVAWGNQTIEIGQQNHAIKYKLKVGKKVSALANDSVIAVGQTSIGDRDV